jgi:multidrug resistance protein MdtO
MAPLAGDIARPGLGEILRLLAPFPGRAEWVFRVALICALTVLVTSIYGTPEAALSAYIVFFLNRADRVTSAVLAIVMLLLVTVVIGLVLVVAVFCVDDPMLRVAAMTVLSVGLLYLASASKLRPVGAILAMIVGFGLDELGIVPSGEVATRGALYAWLMVAIPVGVAVGVNLLTAPSPRKLACRELARRLRLAACQLRTPGIDRTAFDASLREGDHQIATWLKLSKLEGTSSRDDVAALRQAMSSTAAILMAVDLADGEPHQGGLPASFAAPIADTLEQMAGMLAQGGYPVEIELHLPTDATLPPVAKMIAADLRTAITDFARVQNPAVHASVGEVAAKPHSGFFLPDAHTNPDHIRYAFKTTAAAMFCYLLYMQLNWTGIHTCFITCYVVSLGTTAETVEKLTLRIAGCAIGALLGIAAIVYVTPALTSIGQLMALVFAGAWVAAWIAQGSPRIAYAGFQISFAFFLCVIQGAAPSFDLTTARDRVIGILLGNVVVYLVFTRVWPVSIAKQIDAALAALLLQWQRLIKIERADQRRAEAAQALAQYGALEQNLGLVHYEPAWVRPPPEWIAGRRRVLAELGAIEGPLFLLAERAPGDTAAEARLHRIASGFLADEGGVAVAADDAAPAPERPADPARDALLKLADARLADVAQATRHDAPKESVTHAPA